MKSLKELYQRFRKWQLKPFHYDNAEKPHTCTNCDSSYIGEHCPVCGQKHDVGRVSWKSVGQEMIKIWGMESRSILSTILQLLGRPGYLISDYIGGRQQVCYSPVSMLFVMAVFVTLVMQLAGVKMVNVEAVDTVKFSALAKAVVWMVDNLGWGMLITTAFLILPTWLLFRFAPKNPRHTIPEGIYIQLFMSTLFLLFFVLARVLGDWLLWLIPIYYYIAYLQLFGYGIWGTLWRTVLIWAVSFALSMLIPLEVLYWTGQIPPDEGSFNAFTYGFTFWFAVCMGILYVGYRIGKRNVKP